MMVVGGFRWNIRTLEVFVDQLVYANMFFLKNIYCFDMY
jgi:hypothetical protein